MLEPRCNAVDELTPLLHGIGCLCFRRRHKPRLEDSFVQGVLVAGNVMCTIVLFGPPNLPVNWALYSAAVFNGPYKDQLSQNVPGWGQFTKYLTIILQYCQNYGRLF